MSMKRSAKYECPLVCSQNFKKLPIVCHKKKFSTLHKMNNKKELIHITRGIPLFTLV